MWYIIKVAAKQGDTKRQKQNYASNKDLLKELSFEN